MHSKVIHKNTPGGWIGLKLFYFLKPSSFWFNRFSLVSKCRRNVIGRIVISFRMNQNCHDIIFGQSLKLKTVKSNI